MKALSKIWKFFIMIKPHIYPQADDKEETWQINPANQDANTVLHLKRRK